MNMRRIFGFSAGLFVLLSACTALAQSDAEAQDAGATPDVPDFYRIGPYFQGSVVQAWSQFKLLNVPDVDNNIGFDFAIGARLHRYFAAEIDFEGLPNWQIKGLETNTNALMINVKGYFPMSRYQPFILAGGGLLISQHGTDHSLRYGYRLGLGVDVFVTDAFYLSMSYRYTGNLDDYGYTSLLWGIGYQL